MAVERFIFVKSRWHGVRSLWFKEDTAKICCHSMTILLIHERELGDIPKCNLNVQRLVQDGLITILFFLGQRLFIGVVIDWTIETVEPLEP